jgi:HEPN domain-containing protein
VIDVQKQIDYWINGADGDILTADLLIREKRTLHGLFFCHLVIEKAIKAHIVKKIEDVAPRSHNLIYLSEIAELEFDDSTQMFLGILMKYQLQGRYPDYDPILPDQQKVNEYFNKTKEILQWLKVKL